MSIYDCEWHLDKRHGKGRVIYYDDPKTFEQAVGNNNNNTNNSNNNNNNNNTTKSITGNNNNKNAAAIINSNNDTALSEAVNAATESIDTQVRLLAQSYL